MLRILISIVCSPHTLPGTVKTVKIKGVNKENIDVISRGDGQQKINLKIFPIRKKYPREHDRKEGLKGVFI